MAISKVDGIKLKQALEEFGSLQKAVAELRITKKTLENSIRELSDRIDVLERSIVEKANTFSQTKSAVIEEAERHRMIKESADRRGRQYILFEGLVAMLLASHLTRKSLEDLAEHILSLAKESWITSQQPGALRQLFLTTVMGQHMHSYHCNSCGARFIVNMKPQRYNIGYKCPVCGFSFSIIPDELFLEALLADSNSDANKRTQQDKL